MKKSRLCAVFLTLVLLLALAACSPSPAADPDAGQQPPAQAPASAVEEPADAEEPESAPVNASNSASGPQGLSEGGVVVSAGVVLLEEDQPLPLPDLAVELGEIDWPEEAGEPDEPAGEESPPAADPAAVSLPDGLPLYPGAEVTDSSVSADSMSWVNLITADAPEQVLAFYAPLAAGVGWNAIGDPEEENGKLTGLWSKAGVFLTIEADPLPEGGTAVSLVWMQF